MTAGGATSPVFDFTSLDRDGVYADLIRYAQQIFPAELWTDFNNANPLTFLTQQMAYATDLVSYAQNAALLETMLATAVREQNFRNLAKSLDYSLKSASPSSTTLRFLLDPSGILYPFTLSKHVQACTNELVLFQPDADTAVASYPSSGYIDVAATQGAEHVLESFGVSAGTPGQRVDLKYANLLDGTLSVYVASGVYTQVTNLVQAGPTDEVYLVETNEDGVSTVQFGDGLNGKIPPRNTTLQATYKTGGGTTTVVSPGTIVRVAGTSDGSAVPAAILGVTNPVAAAGGGPKQSLANARQNLPHALKANDRAVSLEDYAALAVELVPGVFKANATSGKYTNGSIPVVLFVVPVGGTLVDPPAGPSDGLKNQIQLALGPKKMAGKRVRPTAPAYVQLTMGVDAYVMPGAPAALVASRVSRALLTEFAEENLEFGQTFGVQHAYDVLSPALIPGLARAFFTRFSVVSYAGVHTGKTLSGTGAIASLTVSTAVVSRREWLVRVRAPTGGFTCSQFTVFERQLGTITRLSDTGLVDEQADFLPNTLASAGYVLHPRANDIGTTYAIVGNSQTSITVPSGLLLYTDPGDPYVVERALPTAGRILRTLTTAVASAATNLQVVSSANFLIGDKVRVTQGVVDMVTTITAIPDGSHLTVADPLTLSATGATIDCLWTSDDGAVQFALVQGVTAFSSGDEMYIDTFPAVGDIALRPENFPLLRSQNLSITPIGGVS